MIKQKDINEVNVDDYIRERKKTNVKYIQWSKKSFKFFKKFVIASYPTEFGFKLPKIFHGLSYLGLKHYLRK